MNIIWKATSKTNDGISWISTLLCTAGFPFFLLFCAADVAQGSWNLLSIALTVIFGVCSIGGWINIFFPKEMELVIESTEVRWGRSKRPNTQKRVPVSDIQVLRYNWGIDRDVTMLVTKKGKKISMYSDVLWRKNHKDEFVKAMRENFPDILYEDGMND